MTFKEGMKSEEIYDKFMKLCYKGFMVVWNSMDINFMAFKEGMKPVMAVWIYNHWKAGMYQPVTVKQKTKKK